MKAWRAFRWCATLEESRQSRLHIHLMLQFTKKVDQSSRAFAFGPIAPNCGPNGLHRDLAGQGTCGKKFQQSVDRGMFYVYADKKGTCRDEHGQPIWAGNYAPAWVEGTLATYAVMKEWPQALWAQYKLEDTAYEEYLFRCRGNVWALKRTLDDCRAWEEAREEQAEIDATSKRIKSNTDLYQPFLPHCGSIAWLARFGYDALRYPIAVVLGPSNMGKTEWAKSLFQNPLELKVGALTHFPDGMRKFNRKSHDGLVLDDVRDLKFVTDNQDKLQGKYDARVEFASTQGGTCAYRKYLYATPTIVTINFSTANLEYLQSHDWLGKESNRVLINFDSSFLKPRAQAAGEGTWV